MSRLVIMATAIFLSIIAVVISEKVEAQYLNKHDSQEQRDLEKVASGYIYQTDGQNPPVFIKLGEGNNKQFDALLENFKRKNGFHDAPSYKSAPYMPFVGHENRYAPGKIDLGSYVKNKPFTETDGRPDDRLGFKFEMGDMDDIEAFVDGENDEGEGHGFDHSSGEMNYGFDHGGSSFKYHHDVSDIGGGLKGEQGHRNIDYQGYDGAPYTHNEYKSPGKNSKSGGSYQKAGHYYTPGSKGDSGYKAHHDHDRENVGKYGKDDIKGHYKKASGHSSSHVDEADHFGKHHSATHGMVGHKFGETETHKKGQLTTGFHNVYHKDEYNKEQNFYEDVHKHGKHDKYGGKHKDFFHKDGGYKKGGHHESGYDEAHKGTSGSFNKGGYYDGQRGHSGEFGHKSHQDHKAEYDTILDNKKYGENYGSDDFY
ncbi:filaggrin-like [Daktulosphaira vitifoliae]|uniref:filaggrin-like n=1 Tax=Daktulosphaira vitifoliae TaxID=58002 RepID=UPI0021A9CD8D|nr:filaggrin-like [Daktulosphaira vitifoliae]